MALLVGDIGGTNTRLAIFQDGKILYERTYPSQGIKSLAECITGYLNESVIPIPHRACLAAAGVIEDNRLQSVNLSWDIDGEQVARSTGLKFVKFVNDFEAAAWGTTLLKPGDLIQIGGESPRTDGPRAILGAGTGLGEAIIIPLPSGGIKVLSTEGGHTDLAPSDDTGIRLLAYLMKKFGHVSVERAVSGPGLINIYDFLSSENGHKIGQMHDSVLITKSALEEKDAICTEALRLFSKIFGSESGNLALKCLATGGVYIGGGIAPNILPFLTDGGFRKAFESKGRLSYVLERIPLFVVMEPSLGLLGAGVMALQECL